MIKIQGRPSVVLDPHAIISDSQHSPDVMSRIDDIERSVNDEDVVPRIERIVRVDRGTNQFIDEIGNSRVFHGMAISYKAPPYLPTMDGFHPVTSFADKDIAQFKRLNLNVIRLGVPWAAVEPSEGDYDRAYLDRVLALVRKCRANGIYVIIEAHQDLYAAGTPCMPVLAVFIGC